MPDGPSGDSLQESLEEWRRDRAIARLSRATAATKELTTDPSVQATTARCGTGRRNLGRKEKALAWLESPATTHSVARLSVADASRSGKSPGFLLHERGRVHVSGTAQADGPRR